MRVRGRLTVVVPTYRRPALLANCLRAIGAQTRLPDEVIVVVRGDDQSSLQVIENCGLEHIVRAVKVDRPSQVAALRAGVTHSTGEIVFFTDDDACPHVDWIETLARHYVDPRVVAVGGRDVVYGHTGSRTRRVGIFTWYGRLIGNHHVGEGPPRVVDHLKGVNMSFRRELYTSPDALEGTGAEPYNDLASSRAAAWHGTLVYDPRAVVDHFPGEKADFIRGDYSLELMARSISGRLITLLAYEPRGIRRNLRLAYQVFVGDRDAPGLVLVSVFRYRLPYKGSCASVAGRVILTVLSNHARSGRASTCAARRLPREPLW